MPSGSCAINVIKSYEEIHVLIKVTKLHYAVSGRSDVLRLRSLRRGFFLVDGVGRHFTATMARGWAVHTRNRKLCTSMQKVVQSMETMLRLEALFCADRHADFTQVHRSANVCTHLMQVVFVKTVSAHRFRP